MTTKLEERKIDKRKTESLRVRKQWSDPISLHYGKNEKKTTTILFGGLTMLQDLPY
ncbi:hypothetical protein KHA80_20840 [Anaerobacillus sp. HL2]|nr:hypothetical protein KHA80_20840 [Anaerobacillus sp. HL2]